LRRYISLFVYSIEQSTFCFVRLCHISDMEYVGVKTEQTCRKRQKVVVLRELHRAIIYTTEMSKQITKSDVRDAVHMYPVN
jgi:hypothetical protein